MDNVISVEKLHKTYGTTIAVDDISFDVRRGEIFGILGPNGAGKTTTVEILQGLRSRSSGKIEVLGLDPARNGDKLRPRMGSQLQSSALPERLRVAEAIRLFAKLHREPVDVNATLAAWDLDRLRKRPFGALSGGERQRLFLALALLGDPEIVFLDELTTGLDPTARRVTWDFVRKVRDNGATVVLVTHFMEEAEALCDRVGVVDGGRLVACDTPRALTLEAGGGVEVMFTASGHDPRHLLGVSGVESVTFDDGHVSITGRPPAPVSVAAALVEQGVTPNDYRTRYPNLEDVFLALTGRPMSEGE